MSDPTAFKSAESRRETLSCRVTAAERDQVASWAAAAGCDVAGYVRLAVFQETKHTADSYQEARDLGHQEARSEADAELMALRAQVQQMDTNAVAWQHHASLLQGRLRWYESLEGFTRLVGAVLTGSDHARADLAVAWAPPSHERHRQWRSVAAAAIVDALEQRLELPDPQDVTLGEVREAVEHCNAAIKGGKWLMDALGTDTGQYSNRNRAPEWEAVIRSIKAAEMMVQSVVDEALQLFESRHGGESPGTVPPSKPDAAQ